MAGGQSVAVGEAEVAGAIGVPGGALLAFDDRESRVDVDDVIAAARAVGWVEQALEMEVDGVELRPEAQAAFVVPWEGR